MRFSETTLYCVGIALLCWVVLVGCKSDQEHLDVYCESVVNVRADSTIAPDQFLKQVTKVYSDAGGSSSVVEELSQTMIATQGASKKGDAYWKELDANLKAKGLVLKCPALRKFWDEHML